jgi:cobalamin biosynthesis protein CobT
LDNKHVFKAKVFGEDFNTAVMVMVDHSQSMISGGKIHLAAQTSIVLGEVLNKLGIPFSICGFSTGGRKAAQSRIDTVPVWDRDLYSRWGDHWIGLYKDFDQSWATVSSRLSVMNQNVRYHTYDGESLRWAAQQLLQRKETRKILFWLNDGSPCPTFLDKAISCTSYLKDCIKEVEKICELVAFGVMTDAVKNYYTNCIVVQNIEELPQVCLTQLGKILTRNKKQSLEMG